MKIISLTLGEYAEHTYILEHEGFCAVIDPEESGGRIASALTENNLSPNAILITHAHFDHLRGVNELREIPLYIHRLDAPYVPGRNEELGMPFMRDTIIENKVIPLEDGDTVGPFRLMHVPGHSPGCALYIAPGHVFSGDSLFVRGIPRLGFPLSDADAFESSLARMRSELDGQSRLHAGHGSQGLVSEGLYP